MFTYKIKDKIISYTFFYTIYQSQLMFNLYDIVIIHYKT